MTATVTISHAADWRPVERRALPVCPKCGTRRMDFDGPHAPRFVERDGVSVRVDCSGTVVEETR